MAGTNDLYDEKALAENVHHLQLARGALSIVAGCVAGVLGFNWTRGFAMFAVTMLVGGFVLHSAARKAAKRRSPDLKVETFLPSKLIYYKQGVVGCILVCGCLEEHLHAHLDRKEATKKPLANTLLCRVRFDRLL